MRSTGKQARVDQLEQQILDLQRKLHAAERKADQQRGAIVRRLLDDAASEPGADLSRALDRTLTRPAERALFGLVAASAEPPDRQPSLELTPER